MEWHESLDVGSTTVKLVVLDEKRRERVNRKKKEPLSQFVGRKNGKIVLTRRSYRRRSNAR